MFALGDAVGRYIERIIVAYCSVTSLMSDVCSVTPLMEIGFDFFKIWRIKEQIWLQTF